MWWIETVYEICKSANKLMRIIGALLGVMIIEFWGLDKMIEGR